MTTERKREVIIKKYFIKDVDGHYVYSLPDRKHIRIIRLEKVPIVNHTPAAISRNPYLDADYFFELKRVRDVQNVVGIYKPVWLRQNGKCYYCGATILPDQEKEIVIKDPAYLSKKDNIAYIHSKCINMSVDTFKTTQYFGTSSEVFKLLDSMSKGTTYTDNVNRFSPLKNYLWQQHWAGSITTACHNTGYEIKRVDFKKRIINFKRLGEKAAVARFPEVFFKSKLPVDAVTELDAFLQYLCDKYGF